MTQSFLDASVLVFCMRSAHDIQGLFVDSIEFRRYPRPGHRPSAFRGDAQRAAGDHRGNGCTLRRAAYSTNIKMRGDFSCAFFDRQLRTIPQAFAQPSHLGSLAHIVPRAITAYGSENLKPGDGLLINDPFLGGLHLNDITLISPVFHEGETFGYLAHIAHHVDVGGGVPGSIGVSNEIYQEGVVIPPIRFVKEGQIDRDIFALIRANFRGTKEISGDFRAQTAANRLGWQRLRSRGTP
jgi:N-methylhydantoinase B